MKKMINRTYIEGLLYEHDLSLKVTGANSKSPNTQYIAGTISIATDAACTNIVPIHFTYVTATTARGSANATFTTLSNIISGAMKTVMSDGKDAAAKLRVDSAIALNEFYSDRNGEDELVSVKRNEGGFIHTVDTLTADDANHNRFECDMVITNARRVEANEERDIPEKVILKGAIFNFRNDLLPVEFTVLNDRGMNYFEGLEASPKNPVFTKVKGAMISQTIMSTIKEESAFGAPSVRTVTSSHKDFVVDWASPEPYVWDDESTITSADLTKAMSARELTLANLKQQRADYLASRGNGTTAAAAPGAFNF